MHSQETHFCCDVVNCFSVSEILHKCCCRHESKYKHQQLTVKFLIKFILNYEASKISFLNLKVVLSRLVANMIF